MTTRTIDQVFEAEFPASKRLKHAFKPGFILKVRIMNFTTYSYAEFNLSPTLNMIIGPNGTGKSTLVAAICLGLGGKLELIKRKTMKSMIKSGQTQSTIELTLQNVENKSPIVIQRKFTEKESTWTINNRPTTEKAVKEKCKSLNIQLDNLCHFLPQERVAEFAGLSPEKLLLETERTLGDGYLLEMHEDLIEKDTERNKLATKIEEILSRLNVLIQEKAQLEEEAKKYEDYQTIVKELDNHTKLIPYAQLSELKERQKHIKKQRDDAKRALLAFEKEALPLKTQLEEYTTAMGQKDTELKAVEEKYKEVKSLYENAQLDLTQLNDTIELLKISVKSTESKSEQKKRELDHLKKEYEVLLHQRDNLPTPDDGEFNHLNELRDSKQEEANVANVTIETINDKLNSYRMSIKRIKAQIVENETKLNSKDRLAILESRGRNVNQSQQDSYRAHVSLRNETRFAGQYFEAPVVCCDVPNKVYAQYLEKAIDNNTLISITVTSKECYDEVSKFSFKSYNVPMRLTRTREKPKPIVPVEELRRRGFDGYLGDFIEGPQEVLCMLYDVAKIHNIPVSKNNLTDEQIQNLTTTDNNGYFPFRKFIAGDTLFNVQKSRYGRHQLFYTTEKIPPARFFSSSGLSNEVREEITNRIDGLKTQEDEIMHELRNLQSGQNEALAKRKEITTVLEGFKTRRDELISIRKNRATIEGRIQTKEEQIERLDRESKKDYSDKVSQIKAKIRSKYSDAASKMEEMAKYANKLTKLAVKLNLKEFEILQAQNKEVSCKRLLVQLQEKKEALAEEYRSLKEKYDEIKKGEAATKIQEQSRNYTEEERRELSALAKTYHESGNFTEQMIQEKIQLLEDEKSVMSSADQSSIDNLKFKLNEIVRAEKDLPRFKRDKEDLDKRITNIKNKWEPELTELVRKISLAFNKRFCKVASDGQVELAKDDRFSNWKLQILVKFRQESELKVLDHQSQSGGERAVSTIFFMMSLQGLTDAPIRVVDEINQGMDPKNEKMAHKYLVQTACANNNSQYFLVTPKLLTGLYYHPDMVVHCIYTGPLIDPVEKNSKKPDFMDFNRLIQA